MNQPARLFTKSPKFAALATKFLAFLTIVLGLGLFTTTLFAQTTEQSSPRTASINQSSLTAIPPRLGEDRSLKVKPGSKVQTSVRVRNGSSETLTIKSQAQDFIVGQNGSTPLPIDNEVSNRWSLASWMMLTPNVQEVAPGEIATVNVVIEAPANALAGGHYAMITHELSDGTTSSAADALEAIQPQFKLNRQSASVLQQRVGTLIYLAVDGPINEAAFVRELDFPQFSEFGPVPFSFLVDNQSDIHISPEIGVEIYNLLGRKVETIELEGNNVFPFIARDFSSEWDRVWGFGLYTAKVVMSYGEGGQVAQATTKFWLLPVTIILAALIVLLVLIAIGMVVRRHLLHRSDNERGRVEELEAKVRELEEEKLKQFD